MSEIDDDLKSFNKQYSSRIKKIFIQLHDYQYYHGPYEESQGDKRFIGRTNLLDKLTSLFTSTENSTGAYLITGFRGSGKTSLVNKVINDILNKQKFLFGNPIGFLLLLFFFVLFSFFFMDWLQSLEYSTLIASSILFFSFIFLVYTSYLLHVNTSIKQVKWLSWRRRVQKLFIRITIFKEISFQKRKYYTSYLPWYCLTLIPVCVCLFNFCFFKTEHSHFHYLKLLCVTFYIQLLWNIAFNVTKAYKKNQSNSSTDTWKNFLNSLFKFRSTVFIKLNLGHTKLREVDILRLLSRNLKTELIRYYKTKTFARVLLSFVTLYFLYTLTYLIYYQSPIFEANNSIKEASGFSELFLSQKKEFLIKSDSTLREGIYVFNPKHQINQLYNDCRNTSGLYFGTTSFPGKENNHPISSIEFIWQQILTFLSATLRLADAYIYILYYYFRELLVEGFLLGISIFNTYKPSIIIINFTFIPYRVDYFFLLYLLGLFLLFKKVLINKVFQAKNPASIVKSINELNEIIISEVSIDSASVQSDKIAFNIFTFLSPKSTKKRGVADVREIEKRLIDILEDINKIRFPYSCPDVVVIFDELDKIETHNFIQSRGADEKNETDTGFKNFIKQPNPSFTIDGTRERQQTLQLLLSNLKYFLSSANAKFIFIAGRELYDVSLADISDRNYFMGSIFHDVINVSSFLSDKSDHKPSDITSMIEKYVCQFIIPHDYIKYLQKKDYKATHQQKERFEYYTLQTFNKFLFESFNELFNESDEVGNNETCYKILARQRREKVINTIQHFIIYLTHASNGAPKKITNYFENFIEFLSLDEEKDKKYLPYRFLDKEKWPKRISKNIDKYYKSRDEKYPKKNFRPMMIISLYEKRITRRRKNPYLIFNYNKQYELGVINYITLPIILSISNHVKNYRDKLLVSATFLFDHLLKFHRDGFSWRQIEYIPEILDINRTPELRGFISDVLDHLLQTHLQVIYSGLYTFRYNLRLSNEISYLSKVSEEASASFNFTLDESLSIKHYYHGILARLEERYQKATTDKTQYIHSIAMVHTILADLHFYDEEYSDAILEYLDSIQFLRYNGFKSENFTLLLILIRNMLRLGLAFEKRKTYSSAYETYNELCYKLIEYRDINLKELGLKEVGESKTRSIVVGYSTKDQEIKEKWDNLFNPIKTFQENFPRENINTDSDLFATNEMFLNKITTSINPNIEKIIGKISSFEGLRIVYQPLLARLQIMEKTMLGGIRPTDIFRIENEFVFIQKAINHGEKFLIKVDFYNKIGDILFYKRGNIKLHKELQVNVEDANKYSPSSCVITDVNYYYSELPNCNPNGQCPIENPQEKCQPHFRNFLNDKNIYNLRPCSQESCTEIKRPKTICAACNFYVYSLRLFVINKFNILTCNELETVSSTLKALEKVYYTLFPLTQTSLRILAGLISDIADAQFACSHLKFRANDLREILRFLKNPKPNPEHNLNYRFNIAGIMEQYYFAGKMYKKANDMKGYVWQLTKILYILKEYLQFQIGPSSSKKYQTSPRLNILLIHCEKNILRRAIRGCFASYENTHMMEVSKQKRNISPDLDNINQASLNRSSVNTDVEELNLLFNEIKMLVWDIQFDRLPKKYSTNKKEINGLIPELYLKNLVSPYSETDTIINRISRLNYKTKLNYRLFKLLLECCFGVKIEAILPLDMQNLSDRPKDNKEETLHWYKKYLDLIERNCELFNDENKITIFGNLSTKESINQRISKEIPFKELFCHLIADSIYCLNEVIEISNAYGRSYMLNNSIIGASYEKMIFWFIWHIAIDESQKILSASSHSTIFKDIKKELMGNLKSWMDHDALESQSIVYHAEMAIKRYYAAYETHIGGKEYRYFIDKMYFLNDDFNDKFSHFFAAYERFTLNNKGIGEKLDTIKRFNEISKLYQHEYFTTTSYTKS